MRLLILPVLLAGVGAVLAADPPPPLSKLELVGTVGPDMPTGITVTSNGRVFLAFPRWGDPVATNVGELRNDRVVPYPSAEINTLKGDDLSRLFTVQSVIADPMDRLWLCDTGTVNMQGVRPGAAKLICVDTRTDKVVSSVTLTGPGVLPTTYLNDIRFDFRKGEKGVAYVTDSSANGPNGIVVIDLATGRTWRKLHDHPSTKAEKGFAAKVEMRDLLDRPTPMLEPKPVTIGSDGIALSPDGKTLYYCPLAGRHLYSVSADALADEKLADSEVAATVKDLGVRDFASDGMEMDAQGRLYLTDYEHNAVRRRTADGRYETLAEDARLLWPDTMSVAADGYLYVTSAQLHRQPKFQGGVDRRERPFGVFRVRIDAGPVRLVK